MSPLVAAATLSISAFTVTVQSGASTGTFNDSPTFHLAETGAKVGLTLATVTFSFIPGGGIAVFQSSAFIAVQSRRQPTSIRNDLSATCRVLGH